MRKEENCMQKDISVAVLCSELEQKLIESQISKTTLERYRKVLAEFTVFAGSSSYSQSLGADFLITRFRERGGFVSTDEHSRKEETYFRCIRMLAEYHNFGIIHRRNDFLGEIIWPEPFRHCTESFFEIVIKEGLSYGYVTRSRMIIHDLLMFLDARGIRTPEAISVHDNDDFVKSFYGLSPKGIETKLCTLRRYYRYLYLHEYIKVPLAERLPKASIQGRMAFPAIWKQDEIKKIEDSAERISPAGKRGYAMVLLASRLGLRISDIRELKLYDINWSKKQISLIQHKTQKALLLPLPEDVGWAIIDYLKNGRPVTDSPNVFVRHRPPYDAFPINSTLNHIVSSVLVQAALPPEKNTNVGWHTFRRSLATNLLQNNIEITVISEILGHSDPDIAGKHYIQFDLESLKKCALEVEVKDYVRNKA